MTSYQSGNIFALLFGAVGLIGLLAVASMQLVTGPLRTMTAITQKNLVESQLLTNARLVVIHAGIQANNGDADSDSFIEPVEYVPNGTGDCNIALIGGGCLPNTLGASLTDPFGRAYGYCVWDHGTVDNGHADGAASAPYRLNGDTDSTHPVIALISGGRDQTFQTSCLAYDGAGTDGVSRVVGSDDLVFTYTYAEATAASGGLWSIKPTDADTAEIAKDLEVKDSSNNVTVAIDRATGIGDFLGIATDVITAKTGGSLELDSNVGIGTASPLSSLHINSITGLAISHPSFSTYPSIFKNVQGIEEGGTANTDDLLIQSDGGILLNIDKNGNGIGGSSAKGLHVYDGVNTELFTITKSGDIGIKQPSPGATLDVNGSGNGADFLVDGYTSGGDFASILRQSNGEAATALIEQTSSSGNGGNLVLRQYNSSGSIFEVFKGGNLEFLINNSGNVGVGTNDPKTVLDVIGSIKIGNDLGSCTAEKQGATKFDNADLCLSFCDGTSWKCLRDDASVELGTNSDACSSSIEGSIRYDSINKCISLCDGSSWACQISGVGCDNTPADFSFSPLNGLAPAIIASSEILVINGTDPGCTQTVSVNGQGSPQYRVCSDNSCSTVVQTWTNQNLNFDIQGKYLQVRATSPSNNDATHEINVTVGTRTTTWTITTSSTGSCGGSPAIGQICSDGTVYAGPSPAGNKGMYISRCDLGMSFNGSSCSGTASELEWTFYDPQAQPTAFDSFEVGTDINKGEVSTSAIISVDSHRYVSGTQEFPAAQACADYTAHGHSDWYLPARYELEDIYQRLVDGTPDDNSPDPLIPGSSFANLMYNTSTEAGARDRITIRMGAYYVRGETKSSEAKIRCVRSQSGAGACGTSPIIGDICSDGTVFSGQRRTGDKDLYVARCDIGMSFDGENCSGTTETYSWSYLHPDPVATTDYFVTGATNLDDGEVNTSILIGQDAHRDVSGTQIFPAAQGCADLATHGHSDWFLPARNELIEIYERLVDATPNDNSPDPLIPGSSFAASHYWSSTEESSSRAYFTVFSNGSSNRTSKVTPYRVRCARTQ